MRGEHQTLEKFFPSKSKKRDYSKNHPSIEQFYISKFFIRIDGYNDDFMLSSCTFSNFIEFNPIDVNREIYIIFMIYLNLNELV